MVSKYPNYQLIVEGTAYYIDQSASGYLRLTGPDRFDFLQRQTTNDIWLLAEEQVVVTVLTSPTARILDVYTIVSETDAVGVIALPGRTKAAAEYLRSRIFFMDDVTIDDASGAVSQMVVGGATAVSIIASMGIEVPPTANTGVVRLEGHDVRWMVERGLSAPSYRLLVNTDARGWLSDVFEQAGVVNLSTETYEVLRIEAGLPAVDHELTEDYTPLEVGLDETVSSTKGCYTGQEVLARQVTYNKVAKQLVGLRLSKAVSEGDAIRSEGSQAGEVTSATESRRFGPIALGVVRRAYAKEGTQLTVTTASSEVEAVVTVLPFGSIVEEQKGDAH